MPGNQKPRSRKHRGTQTGSISRARSSRPRSRQEAMAQARNRKAGGGKRRATGDRRDIPPSWRSAIIRGVIFAALLIPVSVLLLNQDPPQAVILSIVAVSFYIPLGYYTEQFFYRRRRQKLQRERAAGQAEGGRRKEG